MSAYMEKILRASEQKVPEHKRVLEINMSHPFVEKILSLYEKDRKSEKLRDYVQLLYDMAVISEGGKAEDPSRLSRLIGELAAACTQA